jgi:putative peptidoglycan lipid II flippase
VIAEPVVRLLFEHGAFDAHSTEMTVFALRFYLLALVSQGAYTVMNRTFFALQDTKTPVRVSLCDVAVHLAASLLFIGSLDHGGLALGTSIGATVNMILVYVLLRRRIKTLPERQLFTTLAKILLASAVMGTGVYFFQIQLAQLLDLSLLRNQMIEVVSSILVGIAIFGSVILPIKIKEVDYVKDLIKERLAK